MWLNNDADLSALRATSAIILFLMGVFVLARVARPLNSWRGALVAGFAAAGIIGAFIPFVANFFALILPTGTTLVATLIALGGAAMFFVICLWLAPLVAQNIRQSTAPARFQYLIAANCLTLQADTPEPK